MKTFEELMAEFDAHVVEVELPMYMAVALLSAARGILQEIRKPENTTEEKMYIDLIKAEKFLQNIVYEFTSQMATRDALEDKMKGSRN